eukprot:gene9399-12659_t
MYYTVKVDISVVMLSLVIAFVGSYISISLCEQIRLSQKECPTSSRNKRFLTFLASFCLGAVAIWGLDIVGMDAITLINPATNEVEHFKIDLVFMFVPLVTIIVFCYAGLSFSEKDVVFSKSKEEIIRLFMVGASNFTMKQVRSISPTQILLFSITKEMYHIVIGGTITGIGAYVMHVLELESLDFRGEIEYDYGFVVLSIFISITASVIAYWTLFRLLSIYHKKESLRLLASLIMTGAICGMYYTSTTSATFVVSEHYKHKTNTTITKKNALLVTILLLLCFLWLIIMHILYKSRKWIHISSYQLMNLDKLINEFQHDPAFGFSKIQKFRSEQLSKYSVQSTTNETEKKTTIFSKLTKPSVHHFQSKRPTVLPVVSERVAEDKESNKIQSGYIPSIPETTSADDVINLYKMDETTLKIEDYCQDDASVV